MQTIIKILGSEDENFKATIFDGGTANLEVDALTDFGPYDIDELIDQLTQVKAELEAL